MAKPIYTSKTFWVNLLALVGSIAAGFGFDIGPEAQTAIVAGVMAVVNIGLRVVTKDAVTLGKHDRS